MINSENKQLQMLVDGELDHQQRREFLASVEPDSPLWRQLAMSFVEKQILDSALGQDITQASQQAATATQASPATTRAFPWWIAIAASLLCGMLLGLNWNAVPDNMTIADKPAPENTTSGTTEISATDSQPETEKELPKLPLEEALARSPRPISLQARRELLKAGYLIDEVSQMTSVQLPGGSAIEMPVRQFNIHYLGNAAYQ